MNKFRQEAEATRAASAPKRKNIAPVRIEHPASAEALRMAQEWCFEMDKRNAPVERGGQVNLVHTIWQLHLSESANQGTGKVTAAGVATRDFRSRVVDEPDHAPLNANVLETDRFMSHLRSLDTPSYFVLVSWARRRTVVDIARELHCSTPTVYGNLKTAVLALTSHMLLRTFA